MRASGAGMRQIANGPQRAIHPLVANVLAVDEDLTFVHCFEVVDQAQERALAGTARPQMVDDLTAPDGQVDAASTSRPP